MRNWLVSIAFVVVTILVGAAFGSAYAKLERVEQIVERLENAEWVRDSLLPLLPHLAPPNQSRRRLP